MAPAPSYCRISPCPPSSLRRSLRTHTLPLACSNPDDCEGPQTSLQRILLGASATLKLGTPVSLRSPSHTESEYEHGGIDDGTRIIRRAGCMNKGTGTESVTLLDPDFHHDVERDWLCEGLRRPCRLKIRADHARLRGNSIVGVGRSDGNSSMNDDYNSTYSTRSVGEQGTEDFRAFIAFNGHAVSTLHDIPLTPSDGRSSNEILDEHHRELTLNMVVECPRWTSAKMTISTTEPFTPIHQAVTSRGRLAYVRNVFPHHGYIWNYGLLPQTWDEGAPLHVCEIGERVASIGDVLRVRVLGILAPRDEGVLSWTLLVVNTADPLAKRLHNLGDVESNCPGIMTATKEWFRLYKLPDNKDENTFDLKDVAHREYARDVVRRAHETWKSLVTFAGPAQLVDLTNVTLRNSSTLVSSQDADKSETFAATELGIGTAPTDPDSATKWWHIGTRL
ncbi:Pantothenate kinase [Mycena chlorophos]|uniref:inorganic diphosphatase n=1 Tax=Mycena chlorophos TaxID=658473 RepID=A0A8H6SPW2_MYCCL|nr:Pantothenate kinase [Mycena chlorophos]